MKISIPPSELLTATQACDLLNIKKATLYTYVSRGRLTPITQAGQRANLYLRKEIEDLKRRRELKRNSGAVIENVLHWGHPIVTTSITEITATGPKYRGKLATELIKHANSFEAVTELLWSGILPVEKLLWTPSEYKVDIKKALSGMSITDSSELRMMRVFGTVCTALGGTTVDDELRKGYITQTARELILAFAGSCAILGPKEQFIAPFKSQPLAAHVLDMLELPKKEEYIYAINAALILSADHELSPSTFSARIAASSGSSLHACIVSALSTLVGAVTNCDRIDRILRQLSSRGEVNQKVNQIALGREKIPGFGLQLYPHGDPRAQQLIELARHLPDARKNAELGFAFVDKLQHSHNLKPNLEIGLVLLCMSLGMPEKMAGALWAIGRSSGWIAHVLEQRLASAPLRPRGCYIRN